MAVKGQRAGDAAGYTGQGQSCVAVQPGVRGSLLYSVGRGPHQRSLSWGDMIYLSLYPETYPVALLWRRAGRGSGPRGQQRACSGQIGGEAAGWTEVGSTGLDAACGWGRVERREEPGGG